MRSKEIGFSMWVQVIAAFATFGGTLGMVMFVLKRQQKQIDGKISKEFCDVQHEATNKILDELKEAVKTGIDKTHEVHVMVERIDARMTGGN